MNEWLLDHFGSSSEWLEKALYKLKQGKGVFLLVDDENRENEGDIIFPAETITIPQMVSNNTCKYETAFTISIEAKEGLTTGVSAADRVTTILTAVKDDCKPKDLCCPGNVFPLCARTGGVLVRRGHTEGAVDLMSLAGYKPAGILCELTNPDGNMVRLPQIINFAKEHDMTVVSIDDISEYKMKKM